MASGIVCFGSESRSMHLDFCLSLAWCLLDFCVSSGWSTIGFESGAKNRLPNCGLFARAKRQHTLSFALLGIWDRSSRSLSCPIWKVIQDIPFGWSPLDLDWMSFRTFRTLSGLRGIQDIPNRIVSCGRPQPVDWVSPWSSVTQTSKVDHLSIDQQISNCFAIDSSLILENRSSTLYHW